MPELFSVGCNHYEFEAVPLPVDQTVRIQEEAGVMSFETLRLFNTETLRDQIGLPSSKKKNNSCTRPQWQLVLSLLYCLASATVFDAAPSTYTTLTETLKLRCFHLEIALHIIHQEV
jgi:hypothetical protein